jgi:hypothetical protein
MATAIEALELEVPPATDGGGCSCGCPGKLADCLELLGGPFCALPVPRGIPLHVGHRHTWSMGLRSLGGGGQTGKTSPILDEAEGRATLNWAGGG